MKERVSERVRGRARTLAALDVAPVNLIYRHDASASPRLVRVATPSSRSVSCCCSLLSYTPPAPVVGYKYPEGNAHPCETICHSTSSAGALYLLSLDKFNFHPPCGTISFTSRG